MTIFLRDRIFLNIELYVYQVKIRSQDHAQILWRLASNEWAKWWKEILEATDCPRNANATNDTPFKS